MSPSEPMSDALVKRLRYWAGDGHPHGLLHGEAADRITALTDRVEQLREAATELVAKLDECAPHVANLSVMNYVRSGVQYSGPSYREALEALRAALSTLGEEVRQ